MPQNPTFSRSAGRVLHSPYFSFVPPELTTPDEVIKAREEKDAERDKLQEACAAADDFEDLPADCQEIWEKAVDFGANQLALQDVYDRTHGNG